MVSIEKGDHSLDPRHDSIPIWYTASHYITVDDKPVLPEATTSDLVYAHLNCRFGEKRLTLDSLKNIVLFHPIGIIN